MRGRLVIKNDYFTSQNIALPIYLDSQNVDSIYKGEASYNDIKKTPIGVYVYIPTNISIMNAGKLQFWFENKEVVVLAETLIILLLLDTETLFEGVLTLLKVQVYLLPPSSLFR